MTPQELFRLHSFLAVLSESETRELLNRALVQRLSAGDVVFRKGDPGDGLYGVLEGRIVVTVESAQGKELILNMFGPGEFFGEIALLDGKGRTATAVARDASRVVFLSRADFLPFLREHHEAAVRIIALLCERLRRTTGLVEDSAFLNVSTRLAKQLAVLAATGQGDCTIRLSQEELAQTLGVTREMVSRQLAIWREAGFLEVGRGWIKVRDGGALDRIVAGG
ncbi:MAG: Crp/Fnr family transcriptional regulator [Enhydrobacter sp.]|nr:Crp/Fnr family transcriptional regulator [Enhydrobacter sp.]